MKSSKMKNIIDILAIVILLCFSIFSVLLFGKTTLTRVDPINFALGTLKYDIVLDRPHPPGYILWILLIETIHYMGIDLARSMELINGIFYGLSSIILYRLLKEYTRISEMVSFLIVLSWLSTPYAFFYRCTGENYISGVFFLLLVVYSFIRYYKEDKKEYLILSAIASGISIGFRLEAFFFATLMILITSIYLYIVEAKEIRKLLKDLMVFLVISFIMASLVMLLQFYYAGGPIQWFKATIQQFGSTVGKTIGFHAWMLIQSLFYTIYGGLFISEEVLILVLVVLLYLVFLLFKSRTKRKASKLCEKSSCQETENILLVMFLVMFIEYFILSSFIHFGKTGYVMPSALSLSIIIVIIIYRTADFLGLRSIIERLISILLLLSIIISLGLWLGYFKYSQFYPLVTFLEHKYARYVHLLYSYPNSIILPEKLTRELTELINKYNIEAVVTIRYNNLVPFVLHFRNVMWNIPHITTVYITILKGMDSNDMQIKVIVAKNRHIVAIRYITTLKELNKILELLYSMNLTSRDSRIIVISPIEITLNKLNIVNLNLPEVVKIHQKTSKELKLHVYLCKINSLTEIIKYLGERAK